MFFPFRRHRVNLAAIIVSLTDCLILISLKQSEIYQIDKYYYKDLFKIVCLLLFLSIEFIEHK
jgi:hypothetical protein